MFTQCLIQCSLSSKYYSSILMIIPSPFLNQPFIFPGRLCWQPPCLSAEYVQLLHSPSPLHTIEERSPMAGTSHWSTEYQPLLVPMIQSLIMSFLPKQALNIANSCSQPLWATLYFKSFISQLSFKFNPYSHPERTGDYFLPGWEILPTLML